METKQENKDAVIVHASDVILDLKDSEKYQIFCVQTDEEYGAAIDFANSNDIANRIFFAHGGEDGIIRLGNGFSIEDIVWSSASSAGQDEVMKIATIVACHAGIGIRPMKNDYEKFDSIFGEMPNNSALFIIGGKYAVLESNGVHIISKIAAYRDAALIAHELTQFPQTSKFFFKLSDNAFTYDEFHSIKLGKNGDDGIISVQKYARHIANQALTFDIKWEMRNEEDAEKVESRMKATEEDKKNRNNKIAELMEKPEILYDYIFRDFMIAVDEGKKNYVDLYMAFLSSHHEDKNDAELDKYIMNGMPQILMLAVANNPDAAQTILQSILQNRPEKIANVLYSADGENDIVSAICYEIFRNGKNDLVETMIQIAKSDNLYLNRGFDSGKLTGHFAKVMKSNESAVDKKDESVAEDENIIQDRVNATKNYFAIISAFFTKFSAILNKNVLEESDKEILPCLTKHNMLLRDIEGDTLLHVALRAGNLDAVKILAPNSNILTPNNHLQTPLYMAALNGNREMFEILFESGIHDKKKTIEQTLAGIQSLTIPKIIEDSKGKTENEICDTVAWLAQYLVSRVASFEKNEAQELIKTIEESLRLESENESKVSAESEELRKRCCEVFLSAVLDEIPKTKKEIEAKPDAQSQITAPQAAIESASQVTVTTLSQAENNRESHL